MLAQLLECRRRLLQIFAFFMLLFMIFFFIAPNLFHAMIFPLIKVLPAGDTLIATRIATPLLTPVKLAADVAILLTTPFALFHIWAFVSPGLYRHERGSLGWIVLGSLILFCLGLGFGFYVILPFMFGFFAKALPLGVRFMPDMADTVDFITRMMLIFGLSFQVPLACLLLVRLKLISLRTLILSRPYVIVIAFTAGMLLTPPDVLSQILVAIPLCLLFESGIVLARLQSC